MHAASARRINVMRCDKYSFDVMQCLALCGNVPQAGAVVLNRAVCGNSLVAGHRAADS